MSASSDSFDNQTKRLKLEVVNGKWLRIGDQSYAVRATWEIKVEEVPPPEFPLWLLLVPPLAFVAVGHVARMFIAACWTMGEHWNGDWRGQTWLGWTLNLVTTILCLGLAALIVGSYAHDKKQHRESGPKYSVYAMLKGGKRKIMVLENGGKQAAEDVRKEFETLVGEYMKADVDQ